MVLKDVREFIVPGLESGFERTELVSIFLEAECFKSIEHWTITVNNWFVWSLSQQNKFPSLMLHYSNVEFPCFNFKYWTWKHRLLGDPSYRYFRIAQKKAIPFQHFLWTILKKAYDPLSDSCKTWTQEFTGYQTEKKFNIDTKNLIQQPLS